MYTNNNRPTIALFTEATTSGASGYQTVLWRGVSDAVYKHGGNLFCIAGGALEYSPSNKYERMRNIVYDMVTPNNVDGLIISGTLGNFLPESKLIDFCNRYKPLKIVSTLVSLPGIPVISIDDSKGMSDLITHLIITHKFRRIAFICGPEKNPEAQKRFNIYKETLLKHKIPIDDNLIAQGNFFPDSGAEAINTFLNKRKVNVEAIVAANDYMALGALEEIQKHGIKVPEQLAIVGFDDIEEARIVTPSLTTVRHPVYNQGQRAVEKLLSLIKGDDVENDIIIDTELKIRHSCGCFQESPNSIKPFVVKDANKLFKINRNAIKKYSQIVNNKIATKYSIENIVFKLINELIIAFFKELNGKLSGLFLSTIDIALQKTAEAGGDEFIWHEIIFMLRNFLLAIINNKTQLAHAELILHQAQVRIAQTEQQAIAYRRLKAEQRVENIDEINKAIYSTRTIKQFTTFISNILPKIGIPACIIALYENPAKPMENSRLILSYNPSGFGDVKSDEDIFHTQQLLSKVLSFQDKPYNLLVEPLFFQENQLGFAVFEVESNEWKIFERLKEHLSGALWTAHLFYNQQKLLEKAEEDNNLNKCLKPISPGLNLSEVSELILDNASLLVKYKKASLHLIENDSRIMLSCRGYQKNINDNWPNIKISEDPLITRVIENKGPLILSNTKDDINWKVNLRTDDVNSWIGIPFIYSNKIIGLLTLDHDLADFFKQEQRDSLLAFANHASISFGNAYHYNIVEERIKQLEIMNDVAHKVTSQLEIKKLLNTFIMHICSYLECCYCAIYLPENELNNSDLILQVSTGNNKLLFNKNRYKYDEDLIGQSYLKGCTINLFDLNSYNSFPSILFDNKSPYSLLIVPLKSNNRTIGIFCAEHNAFGWFIERKQRFIEALALQVAIAIERNNSQNLLENIAKNIVSLQDMRQTLQEILSGAIQLTHTTTGVIYLVNDKGDTIIDNRIHSDFNHPPPRMNIEEGLTRTVIRTGDVLFLKNIHDHPEVNEFLKPHFHSIIAIPLKTNKNIIGVLFLNDKFEHDFTDLEKSKLLTLANQASIAISNTKMHEELKQRLFIQTRLINLTSNIHPTGDVEDIIFPFIYEIETWPGIGKGNVAILEPDSTGIFNFESCKFLNQDQISTLIKMNINLTNESFEIPGLIHFCPLIVEEVHKYFLISKVDESKSNIIIPWLKIARVILQYLVNIDFLISQARKLRSDIEKANSQALVGMITRLYNHEALNGLKAITSWISNSRRGTPNLDSLELRVNELQKNISEVMNATDINRVHRSKCVFNDELDRILKRLNYRNLRKIDGCEIQIDIVGHKHKESIIDPNSLLPIISNLVLNAQEHYKLNHKKGVIKISIVDKSIDNKNYIGFSVLDYAEGISDENREKIFIAGWTTKPNGQGIGLWIVKKLVEACEGKILVESTYGHFTKFIILYPVFS